MVAGDGDAGMIISVLGKWLEHGCEMGGTVGGHQAEGEGEVEGVSMAGDGKWG